MKKVIWIFLVLLSPTVFAQQNSGGSADQQAQFQKQMQDFEKQMQDQMQSLRDTLSQMQEQMKQGESSNFDSVNIEMPGLPEVPAPPGESYSYHGGVDVYDGNDSTKVRVGKWNITVRDNDEGKDHVQVYKSGSSDNNDCDNCSDPKNVVTKFLLLDFGPNNYFQKGFKSGMPDGYSAFDPNPGKSWVVNIHAVNQRLNLVSHHLWLAYGIYFELNSYKYDNSNVIIPKIDSLAFSNGDVALEKNKLSCEYVGVPVTLRFESNPRDFNNSFHFSAGGFGEYLLGARTKTKTPTGDKSKVHDDYNLNRFRYGFTARAGYAWVNIFTNISFSELLASGAGPVLYPFSAGLALEF